jgi:hypothetical protein
MGTGNSCNRFDPDQTGSAFLSPINPGQVDVIAAASCSYHGCAVTLHPSG